MLKPLSPLTVRYTFADPVKPRLALTVTITVAEVDATGLTGAVIATEYGSIAVYCTVGDAVKLWLSDVEKVTVLVIPGEGLGLRSSPVKVKVSIAGELLPLEDADRLFGETPFSPGFEFGWLIVTLPTQPLANVTVKVTFVLKPLKTVTEDGCEMVHGTVAVTCSAEVAIYVPFVPVV